MRSPAPLVTTLVAAVLLPASATAATTGSVAGSLSAKPPKGAESSVVATSLLDGAVVSTAPISSKGTFKVALPPGPYALSTAVVPKPGGGAVATGAFPVSLKKGQKRTKLKVTSKKVRLPKAKKSAAGTRAYVQELGQVTPGVTAFGIEEFTGGTGEWAYLARGLSYLMISDLVGNTPCKTAVVATGRDRELILGELALQKKYRKYFDPKTLTKRNFIISDLSVNGAVSTAADGKSSTVTVTITDSRTGALVDTVTGTLGEDTAFEDAEKLSKAVGERVCRRPAAYELRLTNNGKGTFGTHDTSGAIDSTLTALRSGGAPGEPAAAWSGVQNGNWTGVSATSKVDCTYATEATDFIWSAQLSVVDDTKVKLAWTMAGRAMASLIVTCPVKDAPPFVQGGMPGPSMLGVEPASTTLPLSGGVVPLSGGISNSDGGWSNSGQIVVKPIWASSTS